MSIRYVEVRQVARPSDLSLDLVRHLQCRLLVGRAVVYGERPVSLAAVLGKRWQSVLRDLERERASTLNPTRRKELTRQITLLKRDLFTSGSPVRVPEAHVYVMMPGGELPASTRTVYATVKPSLTEFERILRSLPANGALVMYGEWDAHYQAVAEAVGRSME